MDKEKTVTALTDDALTQVSGGGYGREDHGRTYQVTLVRCRLSRKAVVQTLMIYARLSSLEEAEELVNRAPVVVLTTESQAEADRLTAKLTSAGAEAKIERIDA